MKRWTMAAAMAVATLASAEEPDYAELIAGKTVPLELKLKDLNADWRRFVLDEQPQRQAGGEKSDWLQVYAAVTETGAMVVRPYFTHGKTVKLAGETYLIAYRPQTRDLDWSAAAAAVKSAKVPKGEKLTADSVVALSLLNTRTMGSLHDIRPFNLARELASANPEPPK